jgi:hypothetical protein
MIDSSVTSSARFNPLAGNAFKTRDDLIAGVYGLFNLLLLCFAEGKARVQIDIYGAISDRAACDLEGFARPLFGIAPMVAGGLPLNTGMYTEMGLRMAQNRTT